MDRISVSKKNDTFMVLDADSSLLYEVKDHFTFAVPGAKFSPAFKMKRWDGTISLLNIPACTMYVGLLNKLQKFCDARDYELVIDKSLKEQDSASVPDVFNFIESLNIHTAGKPIKARDYQLAGIYKAIKNKRITLLSPTASGKSFIIYSIIRWILDKEPSRVVLLIVPNIGLVKQMYGDFKDYSSHNGFDVAGLTQTISEGATKIIDSSIVVSTWQSLQKQEQKYFNQFDAIIVDEVHLAKANSIRGIMEKATQCQYRIGLTGTLDGTQTNELVIQGLFGKIVTVATTSDLMKQGHISNINIKCILLEYQDKFEKKLIKGADYHGELAYISEHIKRAKLVASIALKSSGNTLILFNLIAHGKLMYDLILEQLKEENSTRKVFFIHGAVAGDDRNEMRKIVEKEKDAIIVASFGTMSTGSNIKSLHNVILASPTKSIVRLLQSVGRGLRKTEEKDILNLIDIVDDFSGGTKAKNYSYLHFIRRLEIYVGQKFPYKLIKVPI